jgi:DNA polymerase (family 10)
MPALETTEVAALLLEFAQRSALRGGNPSRAKAYRRAAENLATLTLPLRQVIREDRLREIPGVGDAIADIITKLHKTGTHPSLEAMRKEFPAGLLELLTIPGLRPDKVLKIYKPLGICSLAELEDAAKAGRLKSVKGLGAAPQTKILHGLEIRRSGEGRRHLHRAAALLETAQAHLRSAHPELKRITPPATSGADANWSGISPWSPKRRRSNPSRERSNRRHPHRSAPLRRGVAACDRIKTASRCTRYPGQR